MYVETAQPTSTKSFFPWCLGNGIDSVMVDYSGSMQCDSGHYHLEQHGGAICAWQKTTHRRLGRCLVPLVQFPYRIMNSDGELYEIGGFRQQFDPIRSVLMTDIEARIIRLRITTFLADGNLYAERYTVTSVMSGCSPCILFFARAPKMTLPGLKLDMPQDMRLKFSALRGDTINGQYAFDDIRGMLSMAVSAKRPKVHAQGKSGLIVNNLKAGDVVCRFISLRDNTHCKNFKTVQKDVSLACKKGFEKCLAQHSKQWRAYHASTRVSLPDKEMQDVYRKSLWMLRAWQNPDNGFITSGPYNAFKGGGHACFWDMTFMLRALLGANQKAAAQKKLDFYQNHVDQAKHYASQIGKSGAYYPWFANFENKSLDFNNAAEMPDIQKFNNCCVAMQLLDVFRFTGDRNEIHKRLAVVREILEFLCQTIVGYKDGKAFIKSIVGSDENINRINETVHLLTLIKALDGYIEASDIISASVPQEYRTLLKQLKEALRDNYQNGLLMPFASKRDRSTVPMGAFAKQCLALPEGIGARTVREAARVFREKWGLTGALTYRNLVWPWSEALGALAFSVIDPSRTFELLRHVLQFTSSHGIFPEKVRPDGFWILYGYLTSHATFVCALNSLLAADDGKTLFVAAGIPRQWNDLKFSDINTISGFSVSLDLQKGVVRRLVIANNRPCARKMKIRLLNHDFDKESKTFTIDLKPGKTVII